MRRALHLVLSAALLAAVGCDDPAPSGSAAPPATTSAATAASPPATATGPAPVQGPLIEWIPAPDGDVAAVVQKEAERSRKDGRALLVYVGAAWCEPCQRFHQAAERGEIKDDLPPLRMLEFDLDRDADRLAAAGYSSKLIPLFAVPGEGGRASEARMEGSIKGDGAVANIVPRLRALLSRAKGS